MLWSSSRWIRTTVPPSRERHHAPPEIRPRWHPAGRAAASRRAGALSRMPPIVAVTGACGQLGRRSVVALEQLGAEVRAYDRLPVAAGARPHVQLDLSALPAGFRWPDDVSVVLHLAGCRDVAEPSAEAARRMLQANLEATGHALEACGATPRRFVYVSSISVYAATADAPMAERAPVDPSTLYASSKWLGELVCGLRAESCPTTEVTIVRLAQVYGPGSPGHLAVYQLIEQALGDRPLGLGCAPDVTRDLIHLDDAAEGLALAALRAPAGLFNLGYGAVTMQSVADAVASSVGCAPARFQGAPSAPRVLDGAAFRAATGFTARVSLREGIEREIARLRAERGRP
jgi:nucleoside-diphosphate-sugar epimerase